MRLRVFGIGLVFVLSLALAGCVCKLCQSVCPAFSVEALFVSPSIDEIIESRLLSLLAAAQKSICLAMYALTDDQLGEALITAHARGVLVRVILDGGQSNAQGGEYQKLVAAGIPVLVETLPGLMHHKFLVIDGLITVTGSYNWSEAANDDNFENVVIVRNPEVADAFTEEFERLWNELVQGREP